MAVFSWNKSSRNVEYRKTIRPCMREKKKHWSWCFWMTGFWLSFRRLTAIVIYYDLLYVISCRYPDLEIVLTSGKTVGQQSQNKPLSYTWEKNCWSIVCRSIGAVPVHLIQLGLYYPILFCWFYEDTLSPHPSNWIAPWGVLIFPHFCTHMRDHDGCDCIHITWWPVGV